MKILNVKEVFNIGSSNNQKLTGSNNSTLGMTQMLNAIRGWCSYDGYLIETDVDNYMVLIDNGQSCCENWGYIASEDDFSGFIGAELVDVKLTDTSLNTSKIDTANMYLDCGGVQFVDFYTSKGVFQLAVYNGHNGYYGHGIMVVKNDEILLDDTL